LKTLLVKAAYYRDSEVSPHDVRRRAALRPVASRFADASSASPFASIIWPYFFRILTEAMVAERPKKESGHPPMPGGGMGGMDY
jgi:hypothetical protein